MTKILFIVGKKEFFYSLSQILINNNVDCYFLVKRLEEKKYLEKNNIEKKKIFFLPEIMNDVSSEDEFLSIRRNDLKDSMKYMRTVADLDKSFYNDRFYNNCYKIRLFDKCCEI